MHLLSATEKLKRNQFEVCINVPGHINEADSGTSTFALQISPIATLCRACDVPDRLNLLHDLTQVISYDDVNGYIESPYELSVWAMLLPPINANTYDDNMQWMILIEKIGFNRFYHLKQFKNNNQCHTVLQVIAMWLYTGILV